jgi:hypothetical protein
MSCDWPRSDYDRTLPLRCWYERLSVFGQRSISTLRDQPQSSDRRRIEGDPVAACVREMMAERSQWSGTASDFLLVAARLQRDEVSM